MTSKKKPFENTFKNELSNIKLNVRRIDAKITFKAQQEIMDAKQELQRIDKRLAEINPEWCETWRLKRRKQRAERKLKQYRSY